MKKKLLSLVIGVSVLGSCDAMRVYAPAGAMPNLMVGSSALKAIAVDQHAGWLAADAHIVGLPGLAPNIIAVGGLRAQAGNAESFQLRQDLTNLEKCIATHPKVNELGANGANNFAHAANVGNVNLFASLADFMNNHALAGGGGAYTGGHAAPAYAAPWAPAAFGGSILTIYAAFAAAAGSVAAPGPGVAANLGFFGGGVGAGRTANAMATNMTSAVLAASAAGYAGGQDANDLRLCAALALCEIAEHNTLAGVAITGGAGAVGYTNAIATAIKALLEAITA